MDQVSPSNNTTYNSQNLGTLFRNQSDGLQVSERRLSSTTTQPTDSNATVEEVDSSEVPNLNNSENSIQQGGRSLPEEEQEELQEEEQDFESNLYLLDYNSSSVLERYPDAGRNIFQYLLNEPNTLVVAGESVSENSWVTPAQDQNNDRFFNDTLESNAEAIANLEVGEELTLSDHWDTQSALRFHDYDSPLFGDRTDKNFLAGYGQVTVNSHAEITVRRTSEQDVEISANISHLTADYYDWKSDNGLSFGIGVEHPDLGEAGKEKEKESRRNPDNINFNNIPVILSDEQLAKLKDDGKASPFHVASLKEQFVTGLAQINEDGEIISLEDTITVGSSNVVEDKQKVADRARIAFENNSGSGHEQEAVLLPEDEVLNIKNFNDIATDIENIEPVQRPSHFDHAVPFLFPNNDEGEIYGDIFSFEPGQIEFEDGGSGISDFVPSVTVASSEGSFGYELDPMTGALLLADEELTAEDRASIPDNSELVGQILRYTSDNNATLDRSTEGGQQRGAAFDFQTRALVLQNNNLSQSDVEQLEAELFVDTENGLYILRPSSDLSSDQQAFQENYDSLVEGGYDTAVASEIAYGEYFQTSLSGDGDLITNDPARDARFEAAQLNLIEDTDGDGVAGSEDRGQVPLNQTTFNRVFDHHYDNTSRLINDIHRAEPDSDAQAGLIAEAESLVDANGEAYFSFTENGTLDTSNGNITSQVARFAGDKAGDPEVHQQAAAASEAEANGAEGVSDSSADFDELIVETRAEIDRLQQAGALGGNEAALAFLEAFDLALGGIELVGGDFSGSDISAFLSGSSGGIGTFVEAIAGGDAAAWTAFSNDIGVFGASLSDGQRETFLENARGIGVAGGLLTVAGLSGEERNDTLVISGGLVTAISDTMLAAGGETPEGFEELGSAPAAALVLLSRFSGIAAPYAAETDTIVDDIAVDVAEQGPGIAHAFTSPDLFEIVPSFDDAGNEIFGPGGTAVKKIDASTLGTGLAVNLGSDIAEQLIGGDAGRIIGGVGRTVGNQFLVSAGALTPTQAIISGVVEFAAVLGIDIPPQAQTATLIALAAVNASNPVGWAALAIQLGVQFFSMRDWTEVSVFQSEIDADGDGEALDTGFLSTDFSSGFWGGVSANEGRFLYEVVSPNGLLLEHATFDLSPSSERQVSFSRQYTQVTGDQDDGYEETIIPDTLTIDGAELTGTLTPPSELSRAPVGDTQLVQFTPDAESAAVLVENGLLLPGAPDTIPITATVTRRGRQSSGRSRSSDENAAAQHSYEVGANWISEHVAPGVLITGEYDELNPNTGGEDFEHNVVLTPEQFDRISAELGGQGPVTLAGTDPLLQPGVDDPATADVNEASTSGILEVMQDVTVTFNAEDKSPNFYQYMDVNGDGNPDLVRYGVKQDDDGLHDGDQLYEVTLMGPELTDLGLPTIRHPDLNHAARIAQLTPTLMAWGASHPELGQHGHDPVSLYNLADEAGDLAAIEEIYDIRVGLVQDGNLVNNAFSDGSMTDEVTLSDLQSQIQTGVDTGNRLEALNADLGLFEPSAYERANPGLREEIAVALGLPENLIGSSHFSYHYMTSGNIEGRSIDPVGVYLEPGTGSLQVDQRSAGNELRPGEDLNPGEMLLSENGKFAAIFRLDGDLEIQDRTQDGHPIIWNSNRSGNTDNGWVEISDRGELLIRDNDGDVEFSSGTIQEGLASGAFVMRMENSGNLVIRNTVDNSVLWVAGGDENNNHGYGRFIANPDTLTAMFEGEATDSANANRDAILYTEEGALSYVASSPDLLSQWKAEGGDIVEWAREHFVTEGQSGEVVLNENLVELYLAAPSNRDLAMAFRDDREGAIRHYIELGTDEVADGNRADLELSEGETPNVAYIQADYILDTEEGAWSYLASNPTLAADVMASGKDPVTTARTHFREVGWQDSYGMNFDFDVESFLAAPGNGDLALAYRYDRLGATQYFVETALGDLEAGTRADLELSEGETTNVASQYADKILETDLGALTYLASNPGLLEDVVEGGLDPIKTSRDHFRAVGWQDSYGMRFDFSATSYAAAPGNGDIAMTFVGDQEGATLHFIHEGYGEIQDGNRQNAQLEEGTEPNVAFENYESILYTEEGAWSYLASNPALAADVMASGKDPVTTARTHFREVGWQESYGMNFDFDAASYLSAPENADLALAFGQDTTAAAKHFVTDGMTEINDGISTRVAERGPDTVPSNAYLYRDEIMNTEQGALDYLAANPQLQQDIQDRGLDPVSTARTHFQEAGWNPEYGMNFLQTQTNQTETQENTTAL